MAVGWVVDVSDWNKLTSRFADQEKLRTFGRLAFQIKFGSLGAMNMMHSRRKPIEKSQYKHLIILIAKTIVVVGAIVVAGYLIFGYNNDVNPLESKPMVVPLLR